MKLSIVSLLILLGENDMMAGSSLLTTWLGIDSGIDRLPGEADAITFSTGDAIETGYWKSFKLDQDPNINITVPEFVQLIESLVAAKNA